MDFQPPINVYIKINSLNEIIDIGSSIFIKDTYDWIMIDTGYGDKYAHAQSLYLPKPLIGLFRKYNYRYENGKIVEN